MLQSAAVHRESHCISELTDAILYYLYIGATRYFSVIQVKVAPPPCFSRRAVQSLAFLHLFINLKLGSLEWLIQLSQLATDKDDFSVRFPLAKKEAPSQ